MLPIALCWSCGNTVCRHGVLPVFPSSRTLCPASPSLQWVPWASVPHLPRYDDPLRLPRAHLGVVRFSLSSPATLHRSSFLCPFSAERARVRGWSFLSTPGVFYHHGRRSSFLTLHKETIGSPTFPGSPHEHMLWSQTPVVSCTLALAPSGLLPSVPLHAVGFPLPVSREAILMTTTLHISRLNTGPAFLIHPASDSRYRAYPRTSLLTGWLDVSQVGLGSKQRPAPTG